MEIGTRIARVRTNTRLDGSKITTRTVSSVTALDDFTAEYVVESVEVLIGERRTTDPVEVKGGFNPNPAVMRALKIEVIG
ncbi:hypothetical protein [Cupriavidus nantongensis]|uniref:hypothetical protein n=1 Tax=Cupriavidus nantongensis TaxID=1796606 RepID=UPI00123729D8|nr:hypothetical protein [Cupriavidus nantongensis]